MVSFDEYFACWLKLNFPRKNLNMLSFQYLYEYNVSSRDEKKKRLIRFVDEDYLVGKNKTKQNKPKQRKKN